MMINMVNPLLEKVRRRVKYSNSNYVARGIEKRRGECTSCGACCKVGRFPCIFLAGNNKCRIYNIRPLSCRVFPVDKADLEKVNGECTYSFP